MRRNKKLRVSELNHGLGAHPAPGDILIKAVVEHVECQDHHRLLTFRTNPQQYLLRCSEIEPNPITDNAVTSAWITLLHLLNRILNVQLNTRHMQRWPGQPRFYFIHPGAPI
ncbi:hypothetical protein D3C80_1692020 [compost metagenome]